MIAVLLCAGFATRMYPLTRDFPKPLLPVAGRPVIDYLMDQITALSGLDSVYIVTNDRFIHHFEIWQDTWEDCCLKKSIRIHLINDGATENENRLGALADLQFVFRRISSSSKLLVSAGDNIFQFSLQPVWENFLKTDSHYVVALPEKDSAKLKRTGVLELNELNRVLQFHEKPANPPSTWGCPPIYFFHSSARRLLETYLEKGKNKDAPGYFIQYLCQKEPVIAYKPDGFRIDIGSIETYRQAEGLLKLPPRGS